MQTIESTRTPPDPKSKHRLARILVPLMLSVSSLFMALAWIGHLRFKELPYLYALGLCWLVVLPEYVLNVKAVRMGYAVYSGAQMAAFRLCSGVVFVALVSRFVLNEPLAPRQLAGFGLMLLAMPLIAFPKAQPSASRPRTAARETAARETASLESGN